MFFPHLDQSRFGSERNKKRGEKKEKELQVEREKDTKR